MTRRDRVRFRAFGTLRAARDHAARAGARRNRADVRCLAAVLALASPPAPPAEAGPALGHPPRQAQAQAAAGREADGSRAAARGDDAGERGGAGRRDPFVRRPDPPSEPRRAGPRARGLAGLRLDEVRLVGIVVTAGARLAILEGPAGRTYAARAGDRLADGTVREVAGDGVVVTLSVAGAASGTDSRPREMRKTFDPRPGGP